MVWQRVESVKKQLSSSSSSEEVELLSFSLAVSPNAVLLSDKCGCVFVGKFDRDRSLPVDLEQLVVGESDTVVFLVILVEFFFEWKEKCFSIQRHDPRPVLSVSSSFSRVRSSLFWSRLRRVWYCGKFRLWR